MPKPMLNLGCGHMIFPALKPAHHVLVDDALYAPDVLWHNVDKFQSDGVDEIVDLFSYPWPWDNNSFSGALLSHLAEHIPHEIRIGDAQPGKFESYRIRWEGEHPPHWFTPELVQTAHDSRVDELQKLGDGFYAFFSELWRVCEPGSIAHILAPYGFTTGALVDPTHTRCLLPVTFHYLQPDPNAPFEKEYGSHWQIPGEEDGMPDNPRYMLHSDFNGMTNTVNGSALNYAVLHQWNVIQDFYIRLRCVKDE